MRRESDHVAVSIAARRAALVHGGPACSSGESILNAGNEPTTTVATTTTVAVTAPPGETLPPTTAAADDRPADDDDHAARVAPAVPRRRARRRRRSDRAVFWHGLGTEPEETLTQLTEQYNASQDRVRVRLENQGGYKQTIDKYVQSGQDSRPDVVMMPEYMIQQIADSGTVVPVGGVHGGERLRRLGVRAAACSAPTRPRACSGRCRSTCPTRSSTTTRPTSGPPGSIRTCRRRPSRICATYSQAIVDSGLGVGIAFDSGVDSGGGWFIEQWLAQAGEFYADNENGRAAPATRVLYDGPPGVELMSAVQSLITDGLAVTVGDNPNGQDALLPPRRPGQPGGDGDRHVGRHRHRDQRPRRRADPGDHERRPRRRRRCPARARPGRRSSAAPRCTSSPTRATPSTAAAWDYISYLVSAQSQATWAAATGYVPVREDALELEPLASTYATDPRFRVPYDQLLAGGDAPADLGPVLGPLREVRTRDVGRRRLDLRRR